MGIYMPRFAEITLGFLFGDWPLHIAGGKNGYLYVEKF